MEWYWIVLIIVGYLLIGGISAAIANRLNDGIDEDFAAELVVFWPIIIPIFLWIGLIFDIIKGCKWVINELFYTFALFNRQDSVKTRIKEGFESLMLSV